MTDNIFEAMRTRRSVRTFDGKPVAGNDRKVLTQTIAEASAVRPFGDAAFNIGIADVDTGGIFRPATYGVIKGAATYLTMTVGPSQDDALTAGFAMEQIVLRAWELGLGTCWIGGTFKPATFMSATKVPKGQSLDIVVPVGRPLERTRFMDRLARTLARSNNRREFGKLFFVNDWQTPLGRESAFADSLEAMRVAPSSTNSQPWRAVVQADTVHFYGISGRFSNIDMGIGICHFALAEQAEGKMGVFFTAADHPDVPDDKTPYVRSYRREI